MHKNISMYVICTCTCMWTQSITITLMYMYLEIVQILFDQGMNPLPISPNLVIAGLYMVLAILREEREGGRWRERKGGVGERGKREGGK